MVKSCPPASGDRPSEWGDLQQVYCGVLACNLAPFSDSKPGEADASPPLSCLPPSLWTDLSFAVGVQMQPLLLRSCVVLGR